MPGRLLLSLSQLFFDFLGRPPSPVVRLSDGRSVPYRIRRNARSKNLRLTVTPEGELRVVAPQRLGLPSIERMVLGQRDWISGRLPREIPKDPRPASIAFPSVGRSWAVEYRVAPGHTVRVRERSPGVLSLTGAVNRDLPVRNALRRWIRRQGETLLLPWLERLSRETGYRYSKVSIRGQRTRWGSCSPKGEISLNHDLLFLEPELVRYVLIHELCHTAELNHTRAFWALVAKHDPEAREHRKRLRLRTRSAESPLFRS